MNIKLKLKGICIEAAHQFILIRFSPLLSLMFFLHSRMLFKDVMPIVFIFEVTLDSVERRTIICTPASSLSSPLAPLAASTQLSHPFPLQTSEPHGPCVIAPRFHSKNPQDPQDTPPRRLKIFYTSSAASSAALC